MGIRKWAVALAAFVVCLGQSLAAPSVVNFQGVLKAQNVPANGTASFKFALLDSSGSTVWTNDGTITGEPSAAVVLPVQNGLFNAPLGDTTRGFCAFSTSTFATDVRLRVWVSSDGQSFEQLAPDSILTTAPYAAVADDANRVGGLPANSVGRASFVRGFQSGLPAGSTITVSFEGPGITGPRGTFLGFSAQATAATPPKITFSEINLRRPLGQDPSWHTVAKSGNRIGSMVATLTVNGETAVKWSFGTAYITHYGIRYGDDGGPLEEITLSPPSTFSRTRSVTQRAGVEPGIGTPVGFAAGVTPPIGLQVRIDHAAYTQCVPVAAWLDLSISAEGRVDPTAEPMTLRQNVTDNTALFDWFLQGQTHDADLQELTTPPVTPLSLRSARAIQYKLYLADDGLPVEEYQLTGDLSHGSG